MTYDLRRLRRKGLIRRIPKTQRYELTDQGRRIAVFFTKTYARILKPGRERVALGHPSILWSCLRCRGW
jgi:hypothetical protein